MFSKFFRTVTLYVIFIVEIQFICYLQLIRHRMKLLNKLLVNCYQWERNKNHNSLAYKRIKFIEGIRVLGGSKFERKLSRMLEFTEKIHQIQQIYTKLEHTSTIFNAAYSLNLVVILIVKFTTVTSLLYNCCMIIIKLVTHNNLKLSVSKFFHWKYVFSSILFRL